MTCCPERKYSQNRELQDCATVRRDPAQQLQLTSVIYLMTAQLDGVVERCNQQWLTGEGNV